MHVAVLNSQKSVSSALEVVGYILRNVARLEGEQWLGVRRSSGAASSPDASARRNSRTVVDVLDGFGVPVNERTAARLANVSSLAELLDKFMLKGVRLDSHMGLWGLVAEAYPLTVVHVVPTPEQMLDIQCAGGRFVTFLKNPEDQNKRIGRFDGAFDFLMHDLEHAHKFFGDPRGFRGQMAFFKLLRRSLAMFEKWSADPLFTKDMDYLKSDMNSHPVHLFKYLKAIVLTAELRRTGGTSADLTEFWRQLLEMWNAPKEAGLRINHPGRENEADHLELEEFFYAR